MVLRRTASVDCVCVRWCVVFVIGVVTCIGKCEGGDELDPGRWTQMNQMNEAGSIGRHWNQRSWSANLDRIIINNVTTPMKTKMIDVDQIMNDMGMTDGNTPDFQTREDLSTVKIIPDQHHVSAFLNRGFLKKFLFMNDKEGNPLSITITPCTSILLWTVKFWNPTDEKGYKSADSLKTYRTQRTVTFTEEKGRRGIYVVEAKSLHMDSYIHLYATSMTSEPILHAGPGSVFFGNDDNYNTPHRHRHHHYVNSAAQETFGSSSHDSDVQGDKGFGMPLHHLPYNKPRVSVRRLRGNRLHVKWDTSPVNPHLMQYCIVVNTRRDYSSLCAASGERFGVLPPDLLHVTYYPPPQQQTGGMKSLFEDSPRMIMMNNSIMHNPNPGPRHNGFTSKSRINNINMKADDRFLSFRNQENANEVNHFLPNGHNHNTYYKNAQQRDRRTTYDDIIIGCVSKKTNYILNNLHEGRLYYFNVFLKDRSTNLSYPYVRTTLKYQLPKNVPNGLRDSTPQKVKLHSNGKPTTLKFTLNKPCSEMTQYIMPCGGGSIVYNLYHRNRTIYQSDPIDSLDIVKIAMPSRGRYYVRIFQSPKFPIHVNATDSFRARMAEVYVNKRNKRFPLPKLPEITKLTDMEEARTCDSITIQWHPSPDTRDNEYCIFLKEETRKRVFQFKKPNQCDVERSLKSDPYVTLSLCLQRDSIDSSIPLFQRITGLSPNKTYVVQLIVRRHNGKALSYDLHHVRTLSNCLET